MADIGSDLRWILLSFSVLLIAGLYIAGRWGRRQSMPADMVRDAKHEHREVAQPVPQLDEIVSVRERYNEPHVTIIADDDYADDDLPVIHIDGDAQITEQRLTSMSADIRATPLSDAPLGDDEEFAAPQAEQVARNNVAQSNLTVSHSEPTTPRPRTDAPVKKPSTRKIVALRLVAGAQRFDGTQLKNAMETSKLRHGKYDIYHRYDEQELTVFSIASMVEPGTFDPPAMGNMQFQGVMLFAQLPGPMDGILMFEQMLECAEQLARTLGGAIQDERGAVLTPQRAERMRDEIADFQHLLGIDTSTHMHRATGEGVTAP
jgi:cell division protein ZipA